MSAPAAKAAEDSRADDALTVWFDRPTTLAGRAVWNRPFDGMNNPDAEWETQSLPIGNGRLDAVANAIQSATGMEFHLEQYSEHSLDGGSTSRAASYVGLVWGDGSMTWGAGTHTDIIVAGIRALVSAINNK